MLDPNQVMSVFTAALRTIDDLVIAMAGDPTNIFSFYDVYGQDPAEKYAQYQMLVPSTMVVWNGTMGGDWGGYVMWKHKLSVIVRAENAADTVKPVNYAKLWHSIVNKPVLGGTVNIRGVSLLPELDIMDVPSCSMMEDEDGNDILQGHFVIPEVGDTC